ncbi:MAG: hypothetical protein GWN00_24265 [Aliifodinibius sp.]|nr:carbohydrate binding family 9 domain-containing protein [candidate division Zixibacteria bacterium]NIT59220.1 carbohydrate binding family 9 domain-containing protein [Fodinibius sp.]NIW40481.1 hypothetical protein [candidate division Zixibacteria bacterium]NIX57804.1 hypothetical protein [candidate division Zixibacteria bacterium]NIY27803.1 hypothetical protein [Fodinibius sp.]
MSISKRTLAFGFFLIIFVLSISASTEAKTNVPEIMAIQIKNESPKINGDLHDEIWQISKQNRVRLLQQYEPDEGLPATESTFVAVAYDPGALYFAFWCYDSEPEKITSKLIRRDRYTDADYVSVHLDPFHDHQTGFSFHVNAANVQRDLIMFDDDGADLSWNSTWKSATKIQDWGWSVEIKIPLHCLRFTDNKDGFWGIQFVRYISRKTEEIRWYYTPSSIPGFVSRFGHLTGISNLYTSNHIEILPYVVTKLDSDDTNKSSSNNNVLGNTGVDIKYGLSSDLTLDACINPDFGQVELDQPVLNLSVYETQYPERRPFFIEGADLYRMEYTPFYSRRIGRQPRGSSSDPYFAYYTNYPSSTTILGAAKLTGRIQQNTSIAIIGAVTSKETAEYIAFVPQLDTFTLNDSKITDTIRIDTISLNCEVEPAAGYFVSRVKHNLFSSSWIGGVLTLAAQESYYPAITGGMDWKLTTKNRVWSFHGQLIMSRIKKEKPGYGLDLVFEKVAGQHWTYVAGLILKDPKLDLNRLGYLNRNNYRETWFYAQYRTSDDWWLIRNSWNSIHLDGSWNWKGANLNRHINFNTTIQFVNNWIGQIGGHYGFGDFDDLETRGRGYWSLPKNWNVWLSFRTDNRRLITIYPGFYFGNSRTSPWWGSSIRLRIQPKANIEFWIDGSFTHDFNQLMWVNNPNDSTTLFAKKNQDLISLSAGASIVLSPMLSIQFSAQGLLSGLDFCEYKPYLGGNNYGSHIDGYDFDYFYEAMNSTLLLRWEFNPGSTLYLVWTRAHEKYDGSLNDLNLGRDLKKLFSKPAHDLFLIKASYWFSI